MKSIKINANKNLILKLLWAISICDILILLTLFTLSEYFSQNQANTQFQQTFAYIAFNFPKINLMIGLVLIAALMIGIYFLQFAQQQESKNINSTIKHLLNGEKTNYHTLQQNSLLKHLTVFIYRMKKKIRRNEHQRAELLSSIETLGESKAHYFMLLDVMATATLTINDAQEVVQFNQAAQRLFGYEKHEVIGRSLVTLLPKRYRKNHHKKVNGFDKSAQQFASLGEGARVSGLRKSGEEFPVEIDITKVEIKSEKLFIAAIFDISDRIIQQEKIAQQTLELKQNNQQLKHYQKMLEETVHERTDELEISTLSLNAATQQLIDAEKMVALGQMVSSAAHEINTPIGIGVTCASNVLEASTSLDRRIKDDQLTKSDLTSYLAMVEQSSKIILSNMERAASLVHSFKAVSSDQVTDMQRLFNLNEYLEEILLSLTPRIGKTLHEIFITCNDNIVLDTKPGPLSQIIINLIMNSLIHGFEHREHGTIRLAAKLIGGNLELIYKDNGKGLTEEQADKVFDPFYTTKKKQGGTGLGMHIVEDLMKNSLAGQIELMPSEEGICFKLTFPTILKSTNKKITEQPPANN
ncbi:MAG: ATP-binding protein [Psychrobium sp.]